LTAPQRLVGAARVRHTLILVSFIKIADRNPSSIGVVNGCNSSPVA